MPYCTECGENLGKGERFCPNCGAEVGDKTKRGRKEPTRKGGGAPKESSRRGGGINKGVIIVIAIVAIVAIIGAYFIFFQGGPSFDSPRAVARTYVNASDSRNVDLTYRCLSSSQQKNVTKSSINAMFEMLDRFNVNIGVKGISNVDISGNTATAEVKIKITGKNPTTGEQMNTTLTNEVSFLKEDGKWKIDEPINFGGM